MDETSFKKTYFERDSIEYLQKCRDVERVMIVTDHAMVELVSFWSYHRTAWPSSQQGGLPNLCRRWTRSRYHNCWTWYRDHACFKPDTIVALGGGSPMDAAKVMALLRTTRSGLPWLVKKFMDIRKRAFKFPLLGKKTKFIAIPTTSGTGSEVTPFAVISDKANNRKYPIADYHWHQLLPSWPCLGIDSSWICCSRHWYGRFDARDWSLRITKWQVTTLMVLL